MTGTEKQIIWAEKIEKRFLAGYNFIFSDVSEKIQEKLNEIKKETNAAFWINFQKGDIVQLFEMYVNGIYENMPFDTDEEYEESESFLELSEEMTEEIKKVYDRNYGNFYNANKLGYVSKEEREERLKNLK